MDAGGWGLGGYPPCRGSQPLEASRPKALARFLKTRRFESLILMRFASNFFIHS